ncbi:MAG: glycosyltransferase family 4 protein, partial [Candidatus Magasanikbacteria bacterium]|nr:glycosyltransferase family 4 protein [Candidatus Magasanikbacteria bacterium]
KLQNLADKPDNIQLVGHKSGEELTQEISGARAVVAPSEWYENYPLSVLEAMSYGKPIIAANIGGLPEIVRDKKSGLLFNPGNANDLAEKIKLLWSNAELARTLGLAGQKQVSCENNQETYYGKIMAVYQNLLC